jgi:uncharacterized protein YdhG (YjbR/CyaY superfamily)
MGSSSEKRVKPKQKKLVTKQPSKEVDAYISSAPKEAQAKLRRFREIISEVAPTAVERISYQMPFYDYKGRLAWFGLHRTYIGLYLRPPVIEEHMKELAGFGTTKSAVHFPLDEKIPASLVKKLIKARMKKNEAERSNRDYARIR